ncbi:MAG: TolC family protein, partial [Planctomycetaceae bacterium]|nr:TolC family protein [Planctomycetaceae bacterium]
MFHLRPIGQFLSLLAGFGLLSGCQMHLTIGTPDKKFDDHAATTPRNSIQSVAAVASKGAHDSRRKWSVVAKPSTQPPSTNGQTVVRQVSDRNETKSKRAATAAVGAFRMPTLIKQGASFGSAKLINGLEKLPQSAAEESAIVTESAPTAFPIDLPTALRLSGAENWDVQIAAEKVQEARARLDTAKLLWLPSLNGGIGYTKHDGQIQATSGQVTDVSRNSLFVGGGANLSQTPLTGGAGGPARLMVDLSLADAIFTPLAARQVVQAEQARETVEFNDTLRDAADAYYQLVGAQGQLAMAQLNLEDSRKFEKLTVSFVAAGKGSQADTSRARVETSRRKQAIIRAETAAKIAGVELTRILRLGSETDLVVFEDKPAAVEFVSEQESLSSLVAHAHMFRPEMAEHQAELELNRERLRAEYWRPLLPSVHVGASAGGFGGGVNDDLNQLDGRSDFDLLAVWQLKNLGFGARAAQREQRSRFRQSAYANSRIRDAVAADVAKAFHEMRAQRKQLDLSEKNVELSRESHRKNIARIRGLEGLPLEALNALQTLTRSREDYIAAITRYNRAQVRLLHAIGRQIGEETSDPEVISSQPTVIDGAAGIPLLPAPS